jgi:uroporphyrin-III C-methyltransferase/precorrin-2 dehydrogenase/sirohydrochlorin ferrochelatase
MRRRLWEGFAALALRAAGRAPRRGDWDNLLQAARSSGSAANAVGHVTLVGAGPGDPELLTLKAVRALRSADVILIDDLVAPEVLDLARREARRLLVGKTGHRPSCRQNDINALMIGLAKSGERVVRLKAGDPLVFGRAAEEIGALQQAGIPFDVVPGISAAQGAAASLKVPLTQRGIAQRFQVVTGHGQDGRLPERLDIAALADPNATTAVYMPLGTLRELTERLLRAGVEPDRPATAVLNATRPEQQVVAGTVGTIDAILHDRRFAGPCVIIMGKILNGRCRGADREPMAAASPAATAASRTRENL